MRPHWLVLERVSFCDSTVIRIQAPIDDAAPVELLLRALQCGLAHSFRQCCVVPQRQYCRAKGISIIWRNDETADTIFDDFRHRTDIGRDTLITIDGNTITLLGVRDAESVTALDFLLAP